MKILKNSFLYIFTVVFNTKHNDLYNPIEPNTLTDYDDVQRDNKLHIFHSLGIQDDTNLRSVVMSCIRGSGYGYQFAMNNNGAYYRTWNNNDKSDWHNLYDGICTYDYANLIFDFNNTDYFPGIYHLGAPANILNAPISQASYGNVLVIRYSKQDVLGMLLFPYFASDNNMFLVYKTTSIERWESSSWYKIAGTPI